MSRECYLVERKKDGVQFVVLKTHFEKYGHQYNFLEVIGNKPKVKVQEEESETEGPSESDLRFILKDQYGITFKGRKTVEQMLEMLKEAEEKERSE